MMALHGLLDQALAERRVAQVAGDRDGLAADVADERQNFLGVLFLLRQVVDCHVRAFAREGDRGRTADA